MAYDALAPIYDRVMAHVDYRQWLNLIRRVVSRFSTRPDPAIFEIGGGTGVLGGRLSADGFNYVGSDLSPGMCRIALERDLSFFCADGRALPLASSFDLSLFLYDGINYLFSQHDYLTLFTQVHRILNPKGLFLFDITTPTNSLTYFQNHHDCEDFGDCYCMRHSHYDRLSSVQYNDFTLFFRTANRRESFAKRTDHHAQKVLPPKTIKSWIPRELFTLVGMWDGFSFDPANRESERVHFLLRKKG